MSSVSRLAHLLFVLLNVVLVNEMYMSNGSSENHLQLAVVSPRQLAQVAPCQASNSAVEQLKTNFRTLSLHKFLDYVSKTKDLPLSSKLMAIRLTINEVTYSRINKKNIDFVLQSFNELQIAEYKNLCDRLSKKLNDLASKCGMPEAEKTKLWNECQEKISKDMKAADDCYKKTCDVYATKKRTSSGKFLDYLYKYVSSWVTSIETNEKKWIDTFNKHSLDFKAVPKKAKA
ncbi:Plasmodium exported protein (PHIST), unknown function [Plasmodium vivax]|uniref:Plasmodium RESA N-terminal domain-containing protein n=1 Tax=Plasmodium vivax TaxID=5855 RepID=A0A564ZR70_PLAVI|nr:Plasmodium exported protein (PHIST), unknown function [Plasmodium vivax]